MKKFELLDHTADVGLRVYGGTLKEVFQNAAQGMFSIICSLEKVAEKRHVSIEVKAKDRESLLVEWLNELLYLFEVEKILFKKFDIIKLQEQSLAAETYGEEIDLRRHEIETQIKACTYYMLKITKNRYWQAQVIFDV